MVEDLLERNVTESEALDEINGWVQGLAEEAFKQFVNMRGD